MNNKREEQASRTGKQANKQTKRTAKARGREGCGSTHAIESCTLSFSGMVFSNSFSSSSALMTLRRCMQRQMQIAMMTPITTTAPAKTPGSQTPATGRTPCCHQRRGQDRLWLESCCCCRWWRRCCSCCCCCCLAAAAGVVQTWMAVRGLMGRPACTG